MFELLTFSAVSSSLGVVIYGIYRQRQHTRFIRELHIPPDALYRDWWQNTHFWVNSPGEDAPRQHWEKCLLIITHKRLAIYTYPNPEPCFTLAPHELQGFWRPEKYNDATNEIWIHAQIGLTWQILKLRLQKYAMQRLVRAIKEIATEEQIKAYRRRRPYLHREPEKAYPAIQTLQGSWELNSPVHLYLMPLYLVIMQQGIVERVLPLAGIQNIAALRRMEGGEPAGLIRFIMGDETFAFALNQYETWAADLAEAAKRTLEEPLIRKQKGKDEDEDE